MSLTQTYDWNNCDTVQDVVFALCDDPDFAWDSSAEQASFEAHMADCPTCQAYRLDTETSIAGLRQLGNATVIPDADLLADNVIQKLNVASKEAHADNVVPMLRKNNGKQWPTIAAAVVLLVMSIPLLTHQQILPKHQSAQTVATAGNGAAEDEQLVASSLAMDHYLSPFDADSTDSLNDDPIKVMVGF